MINRIFNIKNFARAVIFASFTFLLYWLVDIIFGDRVDFKSNLIKAIIMFIIYSLLGTQDSTWKELFKGEKNKN